MPTSGLTNKVIVNDLAQTYLPVKEGDSQGRNTRAAYTGLDQARIRRTFHNFRDRHVTLQLKWKIGPEAGQEHQQTPREPGRQGHRNPNGRDKRGVELRAGPVGMAHCQGGAHPQPPHKNNLRPISQTFVHLQSARTCSTQSNR